MGGAVNTRPHPRFSTATPAAIDADATQVRCLPPICPNRSWETKKDPEQSAPSPFLITFRITHDVVLKSCPTRIRTWTNRIKICCANRYTIGQFCAGGPVSIRSASASGADCIGSLPTLASPHLAVKLAGWLSRWIRSPPFLVPPRRDSCQGFFTWCCVPVDPSCLSRESRLF